MTGLPPLILPQLGEGLLRNTDLAAAFSEMEERQLSNEGFMSAFVYARIGCRLNRNTLQLPPSFVTASRGLQCKQYPFELGSMLAFAYRNRFAINRYLEIGVERGGTFFAMDALLRAHNPGFQGSDGIDVTAHLKNNGFDTYRAIFPSCRFHQTDSKACPRFAADFVFIDGDHSYSGAAGDFEKFRKGARFVGFHDIRFPGAPGVGRLWQEVKSLYRTEEFVDSASGFAVPLGIGLVHAQEPL